jgi:hypothetical protein
MSVLISPPETVWAKWVRNAFVVSACVCIGFFGGCGRPAPAPPLPQLHIPGVVRLDGLTHLQDKLGVHGLSSLTTYLTTQQGAPARTHLVAGIGRGIYDMALDGTLPVKLSVENFCDGEISATHDGGLAVCRSSDGIYAFPLTAAPAQTHLLLSNTYIGADAPVLHLRAALSPDGAHLAVVTRGAETSLTLYTLSPTTLAVQAIATLALTRAVQAGRMAADTTAQPVWSPSGQYLAFTIYAPAFAPADTAIYLLHVAPFLPATFNADREPLQIPVTTDALIKLPVDSIGVPPLWSADSSSITYVNAYGDSIKRVTIATGQTITVLSQQETYILCYVLRAPDRDALIFDLCRRTSDAEILTPSDQLYLYSGDG